MSAPTGKDLALHVQDWLDEHYPLWKHTGLPAGMRLELHPAAWHVLRTDPDLWRYGSQDNLNDWLSGLEAKIRPDLPHGTWRLATVTETVHTGGTVLPQPQPWAAPDADVKGDIQRAWRKAGEEGNRM